MALKPIGKGELLREAVPVLREAFAPCDITLCFEKALTLLSGRSHWCLLVQTGLPAASFASVCDTVSRVVEELKARRVLLSVVPRGSSYAG